MGAYKGRTNRKNRLKRAAKEIRLLEEKTAAKK